MPGDWADEATQVRGTAVDADHVLLAEADPVARQWLRAQLGGGFWLEEVSIGWAALKRIATGEPRVVIVGRLLDDMTGEQMIEQITDQLLNGHPRPPLLLVADAGGTFAKVDENETRVFYRLLRNMQTERVRELVAQAASALPPLQPRQPHPTLLAAVNEHAKRIGRETDLASAARVATAVAVELLGADRGQCLFCDDETGELWVPSADGQEREAHASAGLVGFAARVGAGVIVPRAAQDPAYRSEIDDPLGHGRERVAIVPVIGADGHVHALLSVVRDEQHPAFTGTDLDRLNALAAAWSPYLAALAERQDSGEAEDGSSDIFRQEAIIHIMRRGQRGDVVRVHPGWVRGAYWLVLGTLVAAGVFAYLAQVHEFTEGPAVVRFTGRDDIVAYEGGAISSLEVTRGQHVAANQVLARLHDAEQAGKMRGLESDFEGKLVSYLQTPSNPTVRQALQQVVSERESARASLESRVIRAPHAGVVQEVLVRAGQRVDPGKVVLSLVEDGKSEGLSVLAFLPGSERPRLRAHQHLRMILPGYRSAVIEGEVRAVSAGALGASDARTRYLGERFNDSLPITGSVVVVEAHLASAQFTADNQTYELHDGMIGEAEVELESRSVLETLVPGLNR
ncbi:MAG TPA: HlyD family efflux transporter periplasmic adaptor subunit [Kofleriaceae bacterium]|nr:HlyD family efflux transporter periplasmic adaptor subunit [Kofleriaceae bacterium]